MNYQSTPIKERYSLARELARKGEFNKADELLEISLAELSHITLQQQERQVQQGVDLYNTRTDNTIYEGATLSVWKSRIWTLIEKIGKLPEDPVDFLKR